MILAVVLSVLVGLFAFVRMAPTDTARWHVDISRDRDADFKGGAVRVVPDSDGLMARLDAVARATPHTDVVAGSVAAGHVTYVTRSALWGFPDFTTVQRIDGHLRLFARLRFGRSDLNVNRSRLEEWLAQAKS